MRFLLAMSGIPHSPQVHTAFWVGAERGVLWQTFPTGSLEFEHVFLRQSCKEAKSRLGALSAVVKVWGVSSP